MIKRFFAGFLGLVILTPQVFAFRDISENSKLFPAIQNLVERGVLKDKGFIRADADVPARMFWEVLLRDAEFNPDSASFDTPLPPNVRETDKIAPFLREAIRRRFIDENKPFNDQKPIKRLEAIKLIVKTKGILPPRTNSASFMRRVSGVSARARYLTEVEAAFASKILEREDIHPLRPFDTLSRRDFITWLYRYNDHGEKKSKLDTSPTIRRKERTIAPKSFDRPTKRRSTTRRRATQKELRFEILDGEGEMLISKSKLPNGAVLEAVFQAINSRYKFQEELSAKKKRAMVEAAIGAMVDELGDKYSSYIEPSKVEDFKEGLNGKFEGIGAYVEMIEKRLTITSPIKGSPAEKSGILAGDVVIEVDGKSLEGMPIRDSIDLIRSEQR